MALKKRRVSQPVGYDVTSQEAAEIKKFNNSARLVEGVTKAIVAGSNTFDIKLKSPGKRLLGIAVIPSSGDSADLTNSLITYTVNGFNLITNGNTANCIPGYVQGMIFFPLPQDLVGNDTISAVITQNTSPAPSISATINTYYVPQKSKR